MATSNQFEIGKSYDFTTYAPALFGTFRAVTVVGIVDYKMANNYIDAAAYHANIFGSIPVGTAVNDHRKYNYLVVTSGTGTTVLGLPWIVDSSVELKGMSSARVHIEGVTADDIPKIKNALSSNGFTVTSVDLN